MTYGRGSMEQWEVVGGADKGGIIVRTACDLSSPAEGSRLSTGSMVQEVEFFEGRLHYKLLSGTGPLSGWVTVNLKGKELLMKKPQEEKDVASEGSTSEGESLAKEVEAAGATSGSGSETESDRRKQVEKGDACSKDEMDAFDRYMGKFGEMQDGAQPGYNRKAFPWYVNKPAAEKSPQEALQAVLSFKPNARKARRAKLTEVDSDGESVPICSRCYLPVGEFAYKGRDGADTCVHSECMAQVLVQDAQKTEDLRLRDESAKKLKNRREYDIGWRMSSVPKSAHLAERMGCCPAPKGLCCLVLDEASRTVRVAATLEPAAAVNLEYLLLALKVRKTASREPMFSLDPVDPKNQDKPQKKVYEPSWLAGTSVGDVMFQADYFLKEISMGEYTMPVAGMLSVFDLSETPEYKNKEWSGREWFVVKKAEVRLAADKTLVPHVKMGVEAREQMLTSKGLEDAPLTAANHPLKKFADSFTRNFDLVAERKSVIYHLRELAKASVMAKYLIDSNARVDLTWYDLADEIVKSTPPEAHPEIPQLWNMRGNSRIQVRNGRVVDMYTGRMGELHAIYGGVQFGLDRFELSQRHALQGQSGPGMQMGQSGRPMFMPQRFQLQQRGETPQGVDLNLDKFSLSNLERFGGMLPACSAAPESPDAMVILGKAFLQALRARKFPSMQPDDEKLLLTVFSSPQCDRTEEGDAFMPPDPNAEYIQKLRMVANEEKYLLDKRILSFGDRSFQAGNPGHEFPRSWTSRFQIEQDGRAQTPVVPNKSGLAKVEVDETLRKALVNDILPTAAPEFNQTTEDGVVFRIYNMGSLEVRTTQPVDGPESVVAVFSSRAPTWELTSAQKSKVVRDDEKLHQCKVYVEAFGTATSGDGKQPCHFYAVFQTEGKSSIVTEKLATGATTWAVNPVNLEDRNSLAKLLFTADCNGLKAVRDLKSVQVSNSQVLPQRASESVRKAYAKTVFNKICDRTLNGRWGGLIRRYNGPAVNLSSLSSLPSRPSLRSTEFGNGMWTSKKHHDFLGKKPEHRPSVSF
eukprot:gb/GFBE01037854.1/.p1 GENE.gb/GFBE01037854.1/~~gb/GFBE01037854.1/.p1  ORF type:complete len:1031 (+),score=267.56 gb/GFBE01037854.1/:1-3093(+)